MKTFFLSILFFAASFVCSAQEVYTYESSGDVDVRITILTDEAQYVKRQIDLVQHSTGRVFETFTHEIVSDPEQEKPIIEALNDGSFTGFIYIKGRDNDVEETLAAYRIVEGKNDRENSTFKMDPSKCTWKIVRGCVTSTIDDMNWVEYGLCLIAAPECYGGIWAACMWDCLNQK